MVKIGNKKCIRDGCENEAQIHPQYGAVPCVACQQKDREVKVARSPEFASLSKANRIQKQRDEHEKDMLPIRLGKENKPNPDFVRAYPEMRSQYFTQKELNEV